MSAYKRHAWGLTLADVHTRIMCLYLAGLAALQTRFHFLMNKDLFYAHDSP